MIAHISSRAHKDPQRACSCKSLESCKDLGIHMAAWDTCLLLGILDQSGATLPREAGPTSYAGS